MPVEFGQAARLQTACAFLLVLGTAEPRPVLGGRALLVRPRLALAYLSQVDEFGHGYFCSGPSRETTSAPLGASAAAISAALGSDLRRVGSSCFAGAGALAAPLLTLPGFPCSA